MAKRKQIGLALGGGAARGCAHIGVIRALEEAGYEITAIAGTSVGAFVGGVYAAGGLEDLEAALPDLTRSKWMSLWDLNIPVSSLIKGQKIKKYIQQFLPRKTIGRLPIPFAAVAAGLKSGDEVVLDSGDLYQSIRASISLPAVFPPVKVKGKYLIDGGLVNPVPVNVLRQWKVKRIVAVDLNYELQDYSDTLSGIPRKLNEWVSDGNPTLFDVVYRSVMMIQRELTISNFQLVQPDAIIRPKVGRYKAFDFHRSQEMIEEGYRVTQACLREGLFS